MASYANTKWYFSVRYFTASYCNLSSHFQSYFVFCLIPIDLVIFTFSRYIFRIINCNDILTSVFAIFLPFKTVYSAGLFDPRCDFSSILYPSYCGVIFLIFAFHRCFYSQPLSCGVFARKRKRLDFRSDAFYFCLL